MKIKLFTVPNILTLCNLICGTTAVILAAEGHPLELCFWLLIASAAFDFLDGASARLLGQYSEIGVQLDSLADMISFGAAPSAIVLSMYENAESVWGAPDALGYAAVIIAAFSALRLARFNIDTTQHEEFLGLPTPACALFFAGAGYAASETGFLPPREVLLAAALVFSLLLICPLRMFSLKFRNLGWRDNSLRYCFLAASAVIIILTGPAGVSAVIGLYIAVSAIRSAIRHRRPEACESKTDRL